jgi:adenine-specific DNA-methyltransferase
MAKIDITRTELVWPGKYNEDGTLKEVPRVSLPFQVIETVNESRATREARKDGVQGGLFDVYEGKEGDTFEAGWRNKLIWGDNLLVMGSLLEKFAGKIDLIYIDPPFAIGADFSFTAFIGEEEVEIEKEQSLLEEKAYRDTWANGVDSYIAMLFPRLQLMRDLLSPKGNLFVHLGVNIASYLRPVLSEVFGESAFTNEIIWKRSAAHSDIGQGAVHLGRLHDVLFWYRASDDSPFHMQYEPYSEEYVASFYKHVEAKTGRRYALDNTSGPGGARKGNPYYEFRGVRKYWRYSEKRIEQLYNDGRLVQSAGGNDWRYKRYLDEMPGVPIQDLWLDIPPLQSQTVERVGYDTQKPERLLQRVMALGSSEGDLVADFFCGSGTTLAVAEKLGRRWIGCDLGRWGIHVTRKRLLGIEKCKPFEVLNLGMYERQYWQSVTFGEAKHNSRTEQTLYEYLAFILKLYGAQPVAGMTHLHGKKGKAMIHIGAVDAPVTIAEIDAAVDECAKLKQGELHVLGWEWEMGLYDLMVEAAKKMSVKLLLLQIPREVMEQQAAAKGDVRFFELAYLEAKIEKPKKLTAQVALQDFVIPNTELIPEDVRSKVKKWSDYIDYWAVDWDFRNDTFMQGWVAYRTRKERKLPLTSDAHTYEKSGKYRILVKVIDIFGNDTSQAFDVEVK